MKIKFPEDFIFGTSTSAYQIETAYEHDWVNVRSRDGNCFNRTTDHEKRLTEDIGIISTLAPHYRMSLMWSRLQHAPFAEFEHQTVEHYKKFLKELSDRGVSIMMVMHHFANPSWFAASGGWSNDRNIDAWVNYAQQLVDIFGPYVTRWNTFNEPNLYTAMAYVAGVFPPFKKNLFTAHRVIRNIAVAHNKIYDFIKYKHPDVPVGISHNCVLFEAENPLGIIPSKIFDWCYMTFAEDLFQKTDYFGMSYYARIGFDPFPITYITTPRKVEKSGKEHDDLWEYYPKGLEELILRFWKKYKKPVIITENGICTNDDTKRVRAICDYMKSVASALSQGADVRGYYHWSSWDNFEWNLGPTFRFGLYDCDRVSNERKKKPSADVYSRLAFTRELDIDSATGFDVAGKIPAAVSATPFSRSGTQA